MQILGAGELTWDTILSFQHQVGFENDEQKNNGLLDVPKLTHQDLEYEELPLIRQLGGKWGG